MIFSLGTQKLQFTIDTSSLALSPLDTLPSRRRRMTTSSPNAIYSPGQCVSTGFSGVGNPIWLRLVVSEAAILWLSTCTPPPAVGFDTDLAVFQVAGNAELERLDQLEQLACNGDGVGEERCQPLYSRLAFSADADRDYFVAIGGYDSRFGANLTLTAEYATPPSPPTPPQPQSPPPPLVEVSSLQSDILAASSVSPLVITLDGVNSINATILVPAPKQVVLRGANSSEPAILSGQGVRLFEVETGAELYLSNLVLRNGFADGQCGGAAYVAGSGVLVAQFVRFENNSALRGVQLDSHLLVLCAFHVWGQLDRGCIWSNVLMFGRDRTSGMGFS
ncbi:hypothetical protein AB1Y20_000239 [Prymnesium parvum]|uniref:Uncharacterized protein n=1 Tax=Prymnesium parvum TaxID=97485 RepID=A0AB34K9H7_PRYPA